MALENRFALGLHRFNAGIIATPCTAHYADAAFVNGVMGHGQVLNVAAGSYMTRTGASPGLTA